MRRATSHFASLPASSSRGRRLLALTAAWACTFGVGCGGSSGGAGPKPGTYHGSTSQGEPLALVVASDGKSLASLSVQAKYTCPAGATALDGVPRSPGGAVPLAGGSFSGSFTARGTTYMLAGKYKARAFTGTLSASFPALAGSGTCTSGSVTWQAALGSAATTGTSTPPPTSTTSRRQQLAVAAAAYNAGAATFNAQSRADAHANNLQAFKADVASFKAVLAGFDTAVRRITFPAPNQAALSALVAADRSELADLDAITAAGNSATAIRFYERAVADNQSVIAAEQALYRASP